MHEITRVLADIESGRDEGSERLLPLVYDELRRLAARNLASERPGHTLQATALVHEAYLRLVGGDADRQWEGRRHFFAAAAEAMRRILIENARRKQSRKRGGDFVRSDLPEHEIAAPEATEDLLALDEALSNLAAVDAQAARLVELRYSRACRSRRPPPSSAFHHGRRTGSGPTRGRGCCGSCAASSRRRKICNFSSSKSYLWRVVLVGIMRRLRIWGGGMSFETQSPNCSCAWCCNHSSISPRRSSSSRRTIPGPRRTASQLR